MCTNLRRRLAEFVKDRSRKFPGWESVGHVVDHLHDEMRRCEEGAVGVRAFLKEIGGVRVRQVFVGEV